MLDTLKFNVSDVVPNADHEIIEMTGYTCSMWIWASYPRWKSFYVRDPKKPEVLREVASICIGA